jgi:arylsulfatase A-like enzyme
LLHRIAALGLIAVSGLLSIRAAQGEEYARKAGVPNVVLILADDLGYRDLSSYGAKDLDTPNIDRLAARGMRFTSFYANCPVCSPTRAALLSGRFQDAVGVPGVIRTHSRNSWGYLAPDAVLLPAVLGEAGYATAMVGKWHLGLAEPNLPNLRGFQFFKGFLGDMMDDYWNHRRDGINYMRRNTETIDPEGHATDLFSQWAADWIKQHGAERPFFFYLAYNAPHSPIQPPEDYLQRYQAKHPNVDAKRAKLAAMVEHMDAGIGRVMQALDESGCAENTLVIFTSDNGGSLQFGSDNGPLAGGKQDMLEGGVCVPMCAVWPGRIAPGTTSGRVALTMDLFATVCEAAGAAVDHTIDGRSILPTLLGKPQPEDDRFLFWVRLEGGNRYQGKPYYAVRRGPWKLLQNDPSEPYRLYNLDNDLEETTDLAARHPEIAALLKTALDAHVAACADVPYRLPEDGGPGEIP